MTVLDRDTKDLFNFVIPEGRLEHFKRRRATIHRNPTPELFVRSTNIINRRTTPPDYENILWTPPEINAWLKEFEQISELRQKVEAEKPKIEPVVEPEPVQPTSNEQKTPTPQVLPTETPPKPKTPKRVSKPKTPKPKTLKTRNEQTHIRTKTNS